MAKRSQKRRRTICIAKAKIREAAAASRNNQCVLRAVAPPLGTLLFGEYEREAALGNAKGEVAFFLENKFRREDKVKWHRLEDLSREWLTRLKKGPWRPEQPLSPLEMLAKAAD